MTSISRCERVTLWLYRLAQHAASGESVAEFCGREGISTVSFYQWKRRLSPQAAKECEGGASAVNSVYESKEIPGFTQLIVNLIGLGEFTRAYGERMPFLFRFKTALVYFPYQLLLSFAAARAIWRLLTNRSSWEKTAHSNLHRQSNAPVAQGSV